MDSTERKSFTRNLLSTSTKASYVPGKHCSTSCLHGRLPMPELRKTSFRI
jgi:hypothetical protein